LLQNLAACDASKCGVALAIQKIETKHPAPKFAGNTQPSFKRLPPLPTHMAVHERRPLFRSRRSPSRSVRIAINEAAT
jgi:hypothetical protein